MVRCATAVALAVADATARGRGALRAAAGLALLIGVAAAPPPAGAELKASVQLLALSGLYGQDGEAWLSRVARARLNLESAGDRTVQGFLQLQALAGDGLALEVPRAYVRVRLPGFRVMVGRNRVTWGEGFYFNAGDVLFGSLDPSLQGLGLGGSRDQTDWLLEAYVPLGRFSFLEGVVLPYGGGVGTGGSTLGGVIGSGLASGADLSAALAAGAPGRCGRRGAGGGPAGEHQAGGGRPLARGEGEVRPYASLQGHLLADWHLSASLAVPASGAEAGAVRESLAVSAGLFHLSSPAGVESLSLRLEAGLRPFGVWEETPRAALSDPPPAYGLLLFPEAVLALSPTLSLQARAVLSPVDGSAFTQAGVSWNTTQGLTLLGLLGAMAGDADDLFGWEQPGGVAVNLGLEYIY